MSDDPYVYANSRTLINRAGIRDEAQLAAFERQASGVRAMELQVKPIAPTFTTEHLKAIHRHVFQDVYDWAGQTRTVQISKGTTTFAPTQTAAHTLDSWTDRVMADLRKENVLQGLDKTNFVERLSHYSAEINFVHPFREGNGRTSRIFLQQVAQHAGYDIDYSKVSRQEWLAASIKSVNDGRAFVPAFEKAVWVPRALAFDNEPRERAVKEHPELRGAYERLAHSYKEAASLPLSSDDRGLFLKSAKTDISEALHRGEILKEPSLQRDLTKDLTR